MKIKFGKRTIIEGSPVYVADWVKGRITSKQFDFPKDATATEGTWSYKFPTTATEEDLTNLVNILTEDVVKNKNCLQKQYIVNQLSVQNVGNFMTIVYRKYYDDYYILTKRKVQVGLKYERMVHADPKGCGLKKSQAWDNSFGMHVSSLNEDRKVFINQYDSTETHTDEHLTGQLLRLAVAYSPKTKTPTKAERIYCHLDGTSFTAEELAALTVAEEAKKKKRKSSSSDDSKPHYVSIDTVFSIYIDKILAIENGTTNE